MKLRDHPLMTRKSGFKNWPPLWTNTYDQSKPRGEIGTLEEVFMAYRSRNKVFLMIQYEGNRYTGFMAFDDERFCSEIYDLLKSKVGLSIKEIGDIDLSYTL
jgi:hypothetical protein